MKIEIDEEVLEDLRDLARIANNYLTPVRCKICGHIRHKGYICCACDGDDSEHNYCNHCKKYTVHDYSTKGKFYYCTICKTSIREEEQI